MDGGTISVPVASAAISSALNTTLRLSQVVYEFKAVGEQARDLLNSTKHVSDNVQIARELRRKKSLHLDNTEKKWIDGVLANTERTLDNVKSLIEPARVDMQTKFGKVGFLNRSLFIFRDSPKVQTNLARLTLASSSLDQALGVLCSREGRSAQPLSPNLGSADWHVVKKLARKSTASLRSDYSGPQPYQVSEPFENSNDTSPDQSRQQTFSARTELTEETIQPANLLAANSRSSISHFPVDRHELPSIQNDRPDLGSRRVEMSSSGGCRIENMSSTQREEETEQDCPPSPRQSRFYTSAQADRSSVTLRPRNSISSIMSSSTLVEDGGNSINGVVSNTFPRITGRQREKNFLAYQLSR